MSHTPDPREQEAAASSGRKPNAPTAGTWRAKAKPALVHLGASCAAAGATVLLVYSCWYPGPLPQVMGVAEILLIMLAVDMVMGPALTFVVYAPRKPRLVLDLATICVLQLAALVAGLHSVYAGRPTFIVFAVDRFEVVSDSSISEQDRDEARTNPYARTQFVSPRWVGATPPTDPKEQLQIITEAASGGRDIHNYPKLYVAYESVAPASAAKRQPISVLRSLNPGRDRDIDAMLAALGRAESEVRFVPLKGPQDDAAVLLAADDGRVLKTVALRPW